MRTALVCVLLLVATAAHADDRKKAENFFRAGAKAYAAQNFAAAAQNFDEAYKVAPMPEIAFSAAQAFRRLYRIEPNPSHVKRAVELYRAYLAVVKQGGRVGDAADNLAEMERELSRVDVEAVPSASTAARTRLGVSVSLADQRSAETEVLREIGDATGEHAKGLKATLDGKPIEPFALVDVEPKEHTIVVAADGYFLVEKATKAVDGLSSLVEIELKPRPASVIVATEEGARIAVDGRAMLPSASGSLELGAGKHLITVLRRGREPFGKEIVVTRGQLVTVNAPLEKTSRRRAVPWLLGGAGVLAGLAITTSIAASVKDGDANDVRDAIDMGNQPEATGALYEQTVRDRDRFVTATWVLGGAAVAAGAVGTLVFLFDNPSAEGVRVSPVIGNTTGLGVAGRF